MRILTVFFMSFVLAIFGVLMAVLPHLWLVSRPWESPLFWGGAIVYAIWWGSIHLLTAEHRPSAPPAGSGGVHFIVLAAIGTGFLMVAMH